MHAEPLAPPLVLVVDDDRDFDATLSPFFARHGLRSVWVASGFAAHEVALRLLPDIVVIGPSAIAAEAVLMLEQFRVDAATRHIPVIATSGARNRLLLDRLTEAGATEIVPLPAPPSSVSAIVSRHARLTRAARYVLDLRRRLADFRARAIAERVDAVAGRTRIAALFARIQETALPLAAADSAGDCVAVNAAACTVSGCTRDQLLSGKAWAMTTAADGPSLEDAWPALLERGIFESATMLSGPPGSRVPVTVYATTHILPGIHLVAIDPVR